MDIYTKVAGITQESVKDYKHHTLPNHVSISLFNCRWETFIKEQFLFWRKRFWKIKFCACIGFYASCNFDGDR